MRHASLPPTLTDEQLGNWLKANAKERFKDPNKVVFTDDEINLKARQAASIGADNLFLEDILKTVKFAVEKGNPETLTIEIPVTDGINVNKIAVSGLVKEISKGFISEERDIFGIPNAVDETMEYFTITGEIVPDRTRALSAKEKHDNIGFLGGAFARTGTND